MNIFDLISTKEMAEKIDELLKLASENDPFVNLIHKNKKEENEHIALFDQLEIMGLVNNLNRTQFQVYPKGFVFIKNGGFTAKYIEKQLHSEREQMLEKLTQAQIKTEKRQPYLILWGVVTTILTLILAWLQLRQS